MKKYWIEILMVAFLVGCGMGFPPQARATSLSVSMTYTYSATTSIDSSDDWPPCAGAVTVNCVTGFNIYDTTSGSPVLLGKVANPSPASGKVTASAVLTLTNPAPGAHTAMARTAYIGVDGTAAESVNSAPATFQIQSAPPSAPASLTIKVQ